MKLLDVQDLDSRLAALDHRLATLPEHAELAALATTRAGQESEAGRLTTRVEDLTREQKKADADVEQVKARRKRDQDRLDQGLVSDPRALEHLTSEVVSLDRRISELEDLELDVMERLEDAQKELAGVKAELALLADREAALLASRDETTAALRAEAETLRGERKQTASGVPADLLALYDKLRAAKDGVGAAALRQRRCGGCGLELSPADLSSIKAKPSDEVVRCEECSRILVRTSESGL